jgi:hypothetical protein
MGRRYGIKRADCFYRPTSCWGWKPTEHTVISAEFGIPIIKDFPVYTFKTQLRMGYLF